MGSVRGRGAHGVAIAASAAAVVAVSAVVAGLGAGSSLVFETLALSGVILGIAVAFGGLDRDLLVRSTRRREWGHPEVTPSSLASAVTARLDALDPVEHRRLELGTPWPTVVIGPTGVVVVSVVGLRPERSADRLLEVVGLATSVVATLRSDHAIDVRGLLVVPDGTALAPPDTGAMYQVDPAGVAAAIARGNLLPMATVDELYRRFRGAVAPDLRLEAV